jgi:transcription antitermination factor NusG
MFAGFPQPPRWHTLRDCRYLTGVVTVAGQPAVITEFAMAQMAQIPATLAARRAEEAERRTIRPGDRATITDGPLAGCRVSVASVHAGIARVILGILGATEAQIEVARLDKAQAVA